MINSVFLALCALAVLLGSTPRGASLWLTLGAVCAWNGLFHVVGTLRTHKYSPGVVSGVLLYEPLAVYGYYALIQSRLASPETAVAAFLLGSSYPLWSTWNHRRRAVRVA